MKLKISTEEENFKTIVNDLRTCGHTGLADSIEQALSSFKSQTTTANTAVTSNVATANSKATASEKNPWEM
jgi:hypothetical protein